LPLTVSQVPVQMADSFLEHPDRLRDVVTAASPVIDTITGSTASTLFNNEETRAALRGMQADVTRSQAYPIIQGTGTALKGAGAVNTFIQEWQNSAAGTTAGRIITGLGAAAVGWVNPLSMPVNIADTAIDLANGGTAAPIGGTISAGINAAVIAGEEVFSPGGSGMSNFNQIAATGGYGAPVQIAASAGQGLAAAVDEMQGGTGLSQYAQDAMSGKYGPLSQWGAELGDWLGEKYAEAKEAVGNWLYGNPTGASGR
jgi:hypothetical protein